uniref:Uncharacterized protein n=1 Tax=Anguilla anguilla TaxID=7936 RepID=A0A0E9Q0A3_ANGAN
MCGQFKRLIFMFLSLCERPQWECI